MQPKIIGGAKTSSFKLTGDQQHDGVRRSIGFEWCTDMYPRISVSGHCLWRHNRGSDMAVVSALLACSALTTIRSTFCMISSITIQIDPISLCRGLGGYVMCGPLPISDPFPSMGRPVTWHWTHLWRGTHSRWKAYSSPSYFLSHWVY